jgi:hypothetical protein
MANKTTCKSGSGNKTFKSQAASKRANHDGKVVRVQKK